MYITFSKAKKIIDENPISLGHITSALESMFNNFIISGSITNIVASGDGLHNASKVTNKVNIVKGFDNQGIIFDETQEFNEIIFILLEEQNNIKLYPSLNFKINELEVNTNILLEGPCIAICERKDAAWNVLISKDL